MAILVSELKKYGAANRPEDDVSVSGGGIDANCVLDVAQLTANTTLRIFSDNAADTTQSITITGRLPSGEISSDVIPMNGVDGTILVVGAVTFERFLKLAASAPLVGNLTVEQDTDGADIVTLPAGKTHASIMFIGSESEAAETDRYEQEIWRNESAESKTLLNAAMQLLSDPSAIIMVGMEIAKDSATSVANRKALPAGVSFFDDGASIAVPGNQLEANSSIILWVNQKLAAGAAPLKSTFTTELSGSSI